MCPQVAAPDTLHQTILSSKRCFGIRGEREMDLIMLFLLRAAPGLFWPQHGDPEPSPGRILLMWIFCKKRNGAPALPGWWDQRERGGPQISHGAMGHLSLAGLWRRKKRQLLSRFSCDNAALLHPWDTVTTGTSLLTEASPWQVLQEDGHRVRWEKNPPRAPALLTDTGNSPFCTRRRVGWQGQSSRLCQLSLPE